jgi:hypothetical protein
MDEGGVSAAPIRAQIEIADYAERTAHRKEQEIAMELELGMLISKLIPYENAEIHLVPGDPEAKKGAMVAGGLKPDEIDAALAASGLPRHEIAAVTAEQRAAIVANADQALLGAIRGAAQRNVNQALLEIETRETEYLSWQFKDLPRLVKRAVRVEYRHKYLSTGLWVTDHLLIGYEGSNGG